MILYCPTCKEKTTREENPAFPFCSERCRQIDLGLWVMESYRMAALPEEKEETRQDAGTVDDF